MIWDILAWSLFGGLHTILHCCLPDMVTGSVFLSIFPIYTHRRALIRYLDWHTTVCEEDYGRTGSG